MTNFNKDISLAKASDISGYHRDYLSYLIREKKLDGHKIGRNWYTNREALNKYLFKKNPRLSIFVTPNRIKKVFVMSFLIFIFISFSIINKNLADESSDVSASQALDQNLEEINFVE